MTGFGSASRDHASGRLSIEVRSVNGRYLDLALRLPEELRILEPMIRDILAAHVRRGKVEVRAHWVRHLDAAGRTKVRDQALDALFDAQQAVLRCFPNAAPLTVADCLAFPGVVDTPQTESAELIEAFTPVAEAAVLELMTSRAREGQRLSAAILNHIAEMSRIIDGVKPRVPQLVAEFATRLSERLHEAATRGLHGLALPHEETMARIRQEVALYGMRLDVAEEIERLTIHFGEVQRVLATGGAVGKRLDFLMQELNREANTLGSKTSGVDLGQAVIDLKVLIEQAREQVQNLE